MENYREAVFFDVKLSQKYQTASTELKNKEIYVRKYFDKCWSKGILKLLKLFYDEYNV